MNRPNGKRAAARGTGGPKGHGEGQSGPKAPARGVTHGPRSPASGASSGAGRQGAGHPAGSHEDPQSPQCSEAEPARVRVRLRRFSSSDSRAERDFPEGRGKCWRQPDAGDVRTESWPVNSGAAGGARRQLTGPRSTRTTRAGSPRTGTSLRTQGLPTQGLRTRPNAGISESCAGALVATRALDERRSRSEAASTEAARYSLQQLRGLARS